MEFKALFVLVLVFLFLYVPVHAIEINPSVESQPFFCRYTITEWTPLCSHGAGTPGKAGAPGTGNNTFLYNSTTNETVTYSNTTSFFNTTIGNNLTTISNYTYFTLVNITYSEMNQTVGPQGPQGIRGIPGPEGPMNQTFNLTPNMTMNMTANMTANFTAGPKGDKGDKGDTGPAGADGAANMTAGPQGPQGIQGPEGPMNMTPNMTAGPQGPQGERGEDGTNGTNGTNGEDGEDGAQGPAGLDANVSTMYPINSIYGSTNASVDPNTAFGVGTWTRFYNVTASTVYTSFIPTMTSNTAPSGNTSKCDTAYSGTYDCYKAFDGNVISTLWASVKAGYPHWLSIQVPINHTIKKYTMWPRNDIPLDTPKNWTLNASTDGSTWTTIDTRSSISWTTGTPQSFILDNDNAYKYYCMTVSATGQNDVVGVGELNFYYLDSEVKAQYYWERTA
jgi:hypothetical protein